MQSDLIDPNVLALAQDFYRDLRMEVGATACAGRQEELTERLARAMQQAVEQEYQALMEELTG